jgi:hypothetical protein
VVSEASRSDGKRSGRAHRWRGFCRGARGRFFPTAGRRRCGLLDRSAARARRHCTALACVGGCQAGVRTRCLFSRLTFLFSRRLRLTRAQLWFAVVYYLLADALPTVALLLYFKVAVACPRRFSTSLILRPIHRRCTLLHPHRFHLRSGPHVCSRAKSRMPQPPRWRKPPAPAHLPGVPPAVWQPVRRRHRHAG